MIESQLKHIQSEHPDAYEKINQHLEAAVMDPDYIFSDGHENTGMVVKRIDVEAGNVALVLRVCTSQDASGYKNSIISGWTISEKRLQNLSVFTKGMVRIADIFRDQIRDS